MCEDLYDAETLDRIEELAIVAGQKALEVAVHESEGAPEFYERAEQAIHAFCDFVNEAAGEPLLDSAFDTAKAA